MSKFKPEQEIFSALEESSDAPVNLEILLNNLPGMAYRCLNNANWEMKFVSQGCKDLTGYEQIELLNNADVAYADIIHPDDRKYVRDEVQKALSQSCQFELQYRIIKADGEERFVLERGIGRPFSAGLFQIEGFITDITKQKQAESKLLKMLARQNAILDIERVIKTGSDLRVILGSLLDQVMMQLEVDAASVALYEKELQQLHFYSLRGFSSRQPSRAPVRLGEGLAGKAALDREGIHLVDIAQADHDFEIPECFQKYDLVGYYGLPLEIKGRLVGILEVFSRSPLQPDTDWFDFVDLLAGQAAVSIENMLLFENLQDSNIRLELAYDNTLEGWSKALELRDRETVGHSHRVVDLTIKLGRTMGLRGEELVHLRRGALLHDIGKMGVPDHIMRKPGPLTAAEWDIMRQHPTHAFNWLSGIEFLRQALDIPYCHHEHWDGSGYPRGLKGTEIPLAARIFAVVDVWDALTNDRPYRQAFTKEEALAQIEKESGHHFDPQIVEVFLPIVRRMLK